MIKVTVIEDFSYRNKTDNSVVVCKKGESIQVPIKLVDTLLKKGKIEIDLNKYNLVIKSNLLEQIFAEKNKENKEKGNSKEIPTTFILKGDEINNNKKTKSSKEIKDKEANDKEIKDNEGTKDSQNNEMVYTKSEMEVILKTINEYKEKNPNYTMKDIDNIIRNFHYAKYLFNGTIISNEEYDNYKAISKEINGNYSKPVYYKKK